MSRCAVTEFERLSHELSEARRDRDAWRELALSQADLMSRVGTAVLEHQHVVTLDGRTLAEALRKYEIGHHRQNALRYHNEP